MNDNALKTFVFIFSHGGRMGWSGDTIGALLERASPIEREGLRNWMERCKPGWHYELDRGTAVCSGYNEQAKAIQCFEDEGHGVTVKSKRAFLEYRRDIGAVQEVRVSWDEGCKTVVIGENGNQLHLSGFGVGYGEDFAGLIWLLKMCGVKYDMETVRNVEKTKEVIFPKMYQTSEGISLTPYGEIDPYWKAKVHIDRANGETIQARFPDDDTRHNLFSDLSQLIDIIIDEMKLRGVKWTADPRLHNSRAMNLPELAAWNKISEKESARIGWNFTTKT